MRKKGDNVATLLNSKGLGLKDKKGAPFINMIDGLLARISRIMAQYGDSTAQIQPKQGFNYTNQANKCSSR
jgi:hypothetical protein